MMEMAPVMTAVRCPLATDGSSRFGGAAGVGELLEGDAPLCSPDCCLVSWSPPSARQMSVRWASVERRLECRGSLAAAAAVALLPHGFADLNWLRQAANGRPASVAGASSAEEAAIVGGDAMRVSADAPKREFGGECARRGSHVGVHKWNQLGLGFERLHIGAIEHPE